MMRILERSVDTEVVHESDARAFDQYMMREASALGEWMARSPSRRVVLKALHEAHRLRGLMTTFAPSRCIWLYRHFDDVVNSIARRWPGLRNMMDEIITEGDPGGWRGLGMTGRTRELLASLYREDMSDATITALFWYQRNQLLFDQLLEADPRCILVHSESLVQAPVETIKGISESLDISYSSYMRAVVHGRSIGKQQPPTLDPRVRAVCQTMYERLLQSTRSSRTLP